VRGSLRHIRRVVAGWLAVPAGWGLRWSGRKLGLALGYHRIGDPQGDPDRELVPALASSRFESQLSHLRRRYRLVPASQLREAVQARRRGQRFPVAITFDDDLPSHAHVAMPILRRVGVPATFFVCGASLEAPFSFWWERLQRAADNALLPAAERERLAPGNEHSSIHELAGAIQRLGPSKREDVAARLAEVVGPDPPDAGLRANDLRVLVEAGFDVGSHTLRHHDLMSLDDGSLEAALSEGRSAVESVTEKRTDLIAYPHGRADARVAAAAKATGYRAGFTMDPEAITPATDPLLMGRVEPTYGTTSRWALELLLVLLRGARR
jgi:peptidoglycan/xylan/chitin deacetylase (PgdA/CDA1 family)